VQAKHKKLLLKNLELLETQLALDSKQEIRSLLEQRKQQDQFTLLNQLPQPDLFKDMAKATQRVVDAIHNQETITIVGDYDVDGVVSTTIVVDFFTQNGIKVNWIVPNRFIHGYGLSPKIVEQINDGLIITVDNGISAHQAASLAKAKGCDVIITDHHTVGETLPPCFAVVNPKQDDCAFPYKDICGAQVAWYFCASIKKALNLQTNMMDFFDILTLAIIADVMPMRSLNAAIVKKGLQLMSNSKRPALQTLKNYLKKSSFNEEDVGFFIAPLINCAGRMDDASKAVQFLLSNDKREIDKTLSFLIDLNNKRKDEQEQIFQESLQQVDENDEVIVVANESWNEGIIGIVAAKLAEKFKKPSFVFSINNEKAKGSSRSITDVHLYDLLNSVSHTTVGFGGHKSAAGGVLETSQLENFKTQINEQITNFQKSCEYPLQYFYKLDANDVDFDLYNIIEEFRPYGLENETPVFYFENAHIKKQMFIGKEQRHQKIILENDIELLLFNNTNHFEENKTISFTSTLSINEFRGNFTLNLIAREVLG
jgi:single-stranded-DNA-specific exonuclease